ncbi:MAG: peroxidase family protein [Reyranellaceae bacterium]
MPQSAHALGRADRLILECLNGTSRMLEPLPQTFGYLLPSALTHDNTGPNEVTGSLTRQQIVDALIALADSMLSEENMQGPADAGMTFFGQFIDHDITFDVTSAIGTKIDPRTVPNVRTPGLDLDCVYGAGPDATPHLYHPGRKGTLLFGRQANPNDLARNALGTALIGDPRNDENILISQVQGAFIQFHNIIMSGMAAGGAMARDVHDCATMGVRSAVWQDEVPPNKADFEKARRFVRLHYQWLVVNDLLPQFVTERCLKAAHDGYVFFGDKGAVLPVEFSGACYRFGHATVQHRYKLRHGTADVDLFAMTGGKPRGPEHDIEFAQFFGTGAQKARPVGTKMARTLMQLPDGIVGEGLKWIDVDIPLAQAKKLNLRNMLRDRTALRCASGQQVAAWLAVHAPGFGAVVRQAPQVLRDRHISKTPLWFYALEEADAAGGKLDGAGGAIVASVILRLLRLDPESVLNTSFKPWSGFGAQFSFRALTDWIAANKPLIANPSELFSG